MNAATTLSNSLTSVDLNGVTEAVTSMVPVVLPVVVGMIALRKGISFLKAQIKGC